MGDRSIASFFRKRKGGPDEGKPDDQTNNTKNAKVTESHSATSDAPAPQSPQTGSAGNGAPALSPAEQERMSAAKRNALMTRAQKTGVPSPGLIGESWYAHLKTETSKPYFAKLMAFLQAERARSKVVYPPPHEVFSWSDACEFKDVKVVILGQDPYHGPGEAHGLCFSVKKGIAIPPSLRNMYKELATDIDGFVPPKHGYLQSWSQQGVLLLNAVLTVQHKTPNSHKDQGWEQFTDAVISAIDRHCDNVVFVLWGNYAKKKGNRVNKKKHCILSGVHPSPLSASRGFFGCQHFSKANDYLKSKGRKTIDWTSVMRD
eukprot:m.229370 g.229370  ORF g.229370 m.229370 type:complete len:317 (+) comp38996_c0_seq1:86-1036(+)